MSVEGLDELQDAFRKAAFEIVPESRRVIARGALAIKQGMAESARLAAPRHAPHFPRSISYDITTQGATVEAEIGPDKERQGTQAGLGNLLAFGSRNNAPVWDYAAPLDAEAPVVEQYLAEAAERLLS